MSALETEPLTIQAVIFDLDGVLLSTDEHHYSAWMQMAERENIYFDSEINERLRGVSRRQSLDIILKRSEREYSDREKEELVAFKNSVYLGLISSLTPADVYPGVLEFLDFLDRKKIKKAIGSSSRNARLILEKIGCKQRFAGAISDGTNISRSKPDPQVFLMAAEMLQVIPEACLVIEDADSGILAAKAAGMLTLGFGAAENNSACDFRAASMADIDRKLFESRYPLCCSFAHQNRCNAR